MRQQNATSLNFSVTLVVQQHILGVLDNVHCFVENLTGFPAVKEFRKSVKI